MPVPALKIYDWQPSGDVAATEVVHPIRSFIPPGARKARRHYGFHPFQGRKDPNVIQSYILHHTRIGDLVLDPFAGSGTTAREALVLRRKVVIVDINPIMEMITRASVLPVNLHDLREAFARVRKKVSATILAIEDDGDAGASDALALRDTSFLDVPIHPVILRGAGRGIRTFRDLHVPRQIFGLLLLRDAINEEKDETLRLMLRAAFSHSLKYATRMYSAVGKSSYWAGDASPFRVLAYQLPQRWSYKNVWEIYDHVFQNVLKGKQETQELIGDFCVEGETFTFIRGSATNLPSLLNRHGFSANGSIDYCIADPPYAEVVQYPLLYSLWYSWLDVQAPDLAQDLTTTARVDQARSPAVLERFTNQFGQCLSGISRALKPGAWLTLFYQHQNLGFWTPIVEAAKANSLQYVSLTPQPPQIRSFAQVKHPFRTVAGNLVVNFRKLSKNNYSGEYGTRGSRVLFPNLRKFAELELQRLIVEQLGADTETVAFHLIAVLLDPNLMSERLDEAVRLADLLRSQDIQSLGFEHRNGREDLWMLTPDKELDPALDGFDRLRYTVFDSLRRKGSISAPEIQAEVLRFISREPTLTGIQNLRVSDILEEFAEIREDGRWHYSAERRRASIHPRLLLSRSSADKLRPAFFGPEERQLRVRVDSVAELRRRYDNVSEPSRVREFFHVLVAVLSELRDRFSDQIESVSAIDEFAEGKIDLQAFEGLEVPLHIGTVGDATMSFELEEVLAREVWGPLYVESGIMFTGVIRPGNDWRWISRHESLALLDRERSPR